MSLRVPIAVGEAYVYCWADQTCRCGIVDMARASDKNRNAFLFSDGRAGQIDSIPMTFVITSACIDVKDQSCIAVCPVDCIYVEGDDRMCYIHPTECINCAVCVEACPVAAIYEEKDLVEDGLPYIRVNANWFEDKAATRAMVDELKASGF